MSAPSRRLTLDDGARETALHRAAIRGDFRAAKRAMCASATILDQQTPHGDTALHFAVKNDHQEVVQLLLAHNASMTMSNNAGASPLDLVLQKKPYSPEMAGLFRSAALLAAQAKAKRAENAQGRQRSSKRWVNPAEATLFEQKRRRELERVSDAPLAATKHEVLPVSPEAPPITFSDYVSHRGHPVLHRIEDFERTAAFRQQIAATGTLCVFVSAPYSGLTPELEAFLDSEASVLERFASGRGVTLEFRTLVTGAVEASDRELLLETSLRLAKDSDAIVGFHGLDYDGGCVYNHRDPETKWVLRAARKAADTVHPPAAVGVENGQSLTEIEWVFGCSDASRGYPRPSFFFFQSPHQNGSFEANGNANPAQGRRVGQKAGPRGPLLRASPSTLPSHAAAAAMLPTKVAELKETVAQHCGGAGATLHHALESYSDPDGGARLCRELLMEWLKAVLPPEAPATSTVVDHSAHLQRMRSLASVAHDEPTAESGDSLLREWHGTTGEAPLCHVADIAGAGKSVLLASFARQLSERPPNPNPEPTATKRASVGRAPTQTTPSAAGGVLYHCTGVSTEAATLHNVLVRLVHALGDFWATQATEGSPPVLAPSPTERAYDYGRDDVLSSAYSDAEEDLILRFEYLNTAVAATHSPGTKVFTWVLDLEHALEQHAADLRWLPKHLSPNLRVVIAAPCVSPLSIALRHRGCLVQTVPRLTSAATTTLVTRAAHGFDPRINAEVFLAASFAELRGALATPRTRWLTTADPSTRRPYFVDRFTGTTSWALPGYMAASASFERWMLTVDRKTNKDYFVCSATRATAWDPPKHPRLAPQNGALVLALPTEGDQHAAAVYCAAKEHPNPNRDATGSVEKSGGAPRFVRIGRPQEILRRGRLGWTLHVQPPTAALDAEKAGESGDGDGKGADGGGADRRGSESAQSQHRAPPGVLATVVPLPPGTWTLGFVTLVMHELLLASRHDSPVPWGSMLSRLAQCQSVEDAGSIVLKRIEAQAETDFPGLLAAWQIVILAYFFKTGVGSRLACRFLRIQGGPSSLRWVRIVQVLSPLVREVGGVLSLRNSYVRTAVETNYLAHAVDRWAAGALCLRFGKSNWRVVHRQFRHVVEQLRDLGEMFSRVSYAELGRQAQQTSIQEFQRLEDQIKSPVVLDVSRGALALCAVEHFQHELAHDELITKLDLTGAVLVGRSVHVLSQGLHSNCYVDTLALAKCRVDAAAVEAVCEAIQTNMVSQVTSIDLRQTSLPRRAVAALASIFHKLTDLNLTECGINASGAEAVADGLAKDVCMIHTLHLSGNPIKDKGLRSICKALATNRTVEKLWLSKCGLQDDGAVALSGALRSNKKLIEVYAKRNRIGNNGGATLIDAAGACDSLVLLSLAHNHIGDEGARRIARSLVKSKLKTLDLSSNASISFEGGKQLSQALESAKDLQLLFNNNLSSALVLRANDRRTSTLSQAAH